MGVSQEAALKETALASRHRELGGKMGAFAGFQMPIQYEGTLKECRAVRQTCGIFDVSHMGTVFVRGVDASRVLQGLFTNDIEKAPVGAAQYTLLCAPDGGVIDDLIIFHLAAEDWMIIPNAANVHVVVAEIVAAKARQPGPVRLVVEDVSAEYGILALQGPRYAEVLASVLPNVSVGRFRLASFDFAGEGVLSGTGYTGSPGVEIVAPASSVTRLWDALQLPLREVGGCPAGLAARDVLRLEMGYPLWGNDIDRETSPLEAGLGWAVAFRKGDFRGAEALRAQREAGVPRMRVALLGEGRRPLRAGSVVLDAQEAEIGIIRSGGFSPLLERGIGLALVQRAKVPFSIDLRGRRVAVEVVDLPFVDLS